MYIVGSQESSLHSLKCRTLLHSAGWRDSLVSAHVWPRALTSVSNPHMAAYGSASGLLWALVTLCFVSNCFAQGPGGPPIPASANVTQLNEYTFQGRISDGRVWFVEFYADWCRSCRRVASHVSMLADNLTATAPEIVVARLDCDKSVDFCNDVIRIEKTPTFKVYHNGKYAITYRSDFFFFDMMHKFITKTAADLFGKSLPPTAEELKKIQEQLKQQEDDDDEYDDSSDDDGTAMLV